MSRTRRRRLSAEERELWERVASSASRLHPERTDASNPSDAAVPDIAPPPAPAAEPPRPDLPLPSAVRRVPAEPKVRIDLAPDPRMALAGRPARMDRGRFEKLRRGRLDPEDRIDLHGMTLERAHGALTGFVLGAYTRGLRLVLVITGKGRPDDSGMTPHRRGILRHNVPHWLAAPPLAGCVLDIVSAHQRHGGGGAYYVYLRRHL